MKIIKDITNFIFLEDEPKKADIIFIPGGAYPEIAEKAAILWKEGYSRRILPSGRYSVLRGYFPGPLSKAEEYKGQYSTEWEFLKAVLTKNGVGKQAILKEDKAENTYQNALYSKVVTEENNLDIKKAILCCKAFHARRCLMYYQLSYPETEFVVCPTETQGVNKENWFMREDGIEKVMGELMRCGGQFIDIFKGLNLEK